MERQLLTKRTFVFNLYSHFLQMLMYLNLIYYVWLDLAMSPFQLYQINLLIQHMLSFFSEHSKFSKFQAFLHSIDTYDLVMFEPSQKEECAIC